MKQELGRLLQDTHQYNPDYQQIQSSLLVILPSDRVSALLSRSVHWKIAVTSHCSNWYRIVQNYSQWSILQKISNISVLKIPPK